MQVLQNKNVSRAEKNTLQRQMNETKSEEYGKYLYP